MDGVKTMDWSNSKPGMGNRHGKLLCVDDSPTFRVFLNLALRENWSEIEVVDSAEIGLELAKNTVEKGPLFEAFVLDIEMGATNGFALARCLRDLPGYRTTPIFFLSASSESSQIKTAEQLGNGLIPKHKHGLEELVVVINDTIESYFREVMRETA